MKALIIKQALSLGTFALAAMGAFATHSGNANERSLPIVQGFVQGNPQHTVCETPRNCNTEVNQWMCKLNDLSGAQLYGKSGTKCEVPLYRIVPE
jgi:hypothetical protein